MEETRLLYTGNEELKLDHYFSEPAIEKMREKGKEFTLDADGQGNRAST